LHDSERRPGSGRPSLLSADHAPAQDDRSVLSQLDGRSAPARAAPHRAAPARHDRQRGLRAAVFGVAFAGIATLAWLAFGSIAQQPPETQLAAASLPAPAARAAVPVEAPVAVAQIQEEQAAPGAGAKDLNDALHATPAPAALPAKTELATLLDAPAPATVKAAPGTPRKNSAAKPAANKVARSEKPRVAAALAKPKPVQKAAPKKAAPVDTDVALLAALLAHTKTPEAGSPEEIYKRCATNATAAEVQRCRVRVCQGSAKGAAECKSVRISKVSS